ncbi:MAG TPA: DUF4173 domain-containing protein [Anaerolineaceae bacterium]|nr:DUF4173 domain-containing protein [Anaerolineaceae bacterium]
MLKHPLRFLPVALALAWAVDLFFWNKPLGLSFTLWTLLILGGGFYLIHAEGRRIHWSGWVLGALALALSAAPLLRLEELTRFLNVFLTLLALGLSILTARTGHWLYYRLVDWLTGGFELFGAALTRATDLFRSAPAPVGEDGQPVAKPASPWRKLWSVAWRVVLGLMLAFPIVLVLGALLASADPIFANKLEGLLEIFKIDNLPEYIFRFFYVVALAYLFGGLLVHAAVPHKQAERPDPQKPWMKGFLGPIETGVILAAVDVLFAAFVIVQFGYFFGGATANINAAGYTFSEYAVKGFNELVTVAVLSLGLYLTLSLINRRETVNHQRSFTWFSVLLFGLVLVMLISSWYRLGLYEDAYGFTRLRTYTHLFIPWLGALLVVVILLEIFKRRGHFGLALWLFSIGFALTLTLVNVDGFIVHQNTARAVTDGEFSVVSDGGSGGRWSVDPDTFDFGYLSDLSHDAVPALLNEYQQDHPAAVRDLLGAQLACRAAVMQTTDPRPWIAYNLGEARARQILLDPANQALWSEYPVSHPESWKYEVEVNGETLNCNSWGYAD